jgi:transaldolase
MKIFLQSASFEDLEYVAEAGLLDGIALSLIDLADDAAELHDQITELASRFAVPICVPVGAILGDEVYREGRELARISDLVTVQVPFVEDTVHPIRKLVAEGVRVCTTYVYSGVQAFLAAKVGAVMTMMHVDDLDAHGQHSARVVAEVREVIDRANLECDLLVASPRSSTHLTECLLAGADTVCTTREMLATFMTHSLTDRGIDRMLSSLSKRHRPRSI